MKFCIECGTKRIDNAKFCSECGFKFPASKEQIQDDKKTTKNIQPPLEEFSYICETEGYYEYLSFIEKHFNLITPGSISVACKRFKNLKGYEDLINKLETHFNFKTGDGYENARYGKITDFIRTEFYRVYNIKMVDQIYRSDKIEEIKENESKKNNNGFLDGIELALDLLSPVSAAKRVIKEINKD